MAASASTGAVEVAAVISDTLAYKIRRELVSGNFARGGEIDAATLASKRSQIAAWEAARGAGVVRTRAAKWSRMLTDIATDTKEARDAAVDARRILMGEDVPRGGGQSDKERLKQLRLLKTNQNNEILELREREAVRLRDLRRAAETEEAKAAHVAKVAEAKAAKAARVAKFADEKAAKVAEKTAANAEKARAKAAAKAEKVAKPKAANKRQRTPETSDTRQPKLTFGSSAGSSQGQKPVQDVEEAASEVEQQEMAESAAAEP
jgi:hypothetical protein